MPSTTGSDDRSHDKKDEHTSKREDQLTTAPKSLCPGKGATVKLTMTISCRPIAL